MPSTSMLIAFDAAARNGSFVKASIELSLTQGAISRQVAALENQLDVVLFERIGRSVQLTDAGHAYADEIRLGLDAIRNAAVRAFANPMSGTLNIAILPTFGSRWLMPRLPRFFEANPDITMSFITKLSPFDFNREDVHTAIHFGDTNWQGAKSQFLMAEEAVPVASPAFKSQYTLTQPCDLSGVPLLNIASRVNAWSHWFEENNLVAPTIQGSLFEQFELVAKAAVAGIGVALLPKFLIDSELRRNELIVLFDEPLKSNSAYYIVTPRQYTNYTPAVAFRKWLVLTAHSTH